MALYEQSGDPTFGSPTAKTESKSLRITWPASWGVTLLAVWLIITGVLMLLPASAVLVALNGILAIVAGVLLFIGK